MNDKQRDDFVALYSRVNESFTRTLVFHAGIDAGFFAEFKYIVNAVLFCLQNKIRFILYSSDANFAVERGWDDFFKPFCTEVTDTFHSRYNVHTLPPMSELRQRNPHIGIVKLVAWKFKTFLCAIVCRIKSRVCYGRDTLSAYDVPVNPASHYCIPEMSMDCDYLEAFRKIADMMWRFNDDMSRRMNTIIETLALPPHYAGMQIRGGDKITEVSLLPPAIFVDTLRHVSPLRDVLLLTDDYGILEKMHREYPDYTWHSLCAPSEAGYVNAAFAHTAASAKKEQMTRFLAQVDALLRSDAFVGSITVGPSLFVLQMLYPRGTAVDCDTEELPRIAAQTIRERGEAARRYIATRKGKHENDV